MCMRERARTDLDGRRRRRRVTAANDGDEDDEAKALSLLNVNGGFTVVSLCPLLLVFFGGLCLYNYA